MYSIHHTHLAQWQQLVYDCRHSGMTVRAWCAQNGVSEKTYFYRQRKVWEAAQPEAMNQGLSPQPAVPTIIPCAAPIAPAGKESTVAPALVLRRGAWTVEVAAGCDPELLRLALRAVK
ncbi:MAG: IS66 family insertion sequence element accessory protein TnpA [Christensenellales bacterium]